MRKVLLILVVAALLATALHVQAQDYDDPLVYMKAVDKVQADFTKIYLAYISAAWHSNRAGKIERLRQQVVDNLTTCRYKIIDLPYFKHDNSLRQSNIDYLWLLGKVFNDDYSHLVNMEELIDQSFDKMELYLRFEEKINDTIKVANDRMLQAQKDFAAKYKVTLVDTKSDVVAKMDVSNNVKKYHNRVYLLFFKCDWQLGQLMEAISKKNITTIEQAQSALVKYADGGLAAVDTLGTYDNDASLAGACKQALTFYKTRTEADMPKISDYFLKEEAFAKTKAAYDAKPQNTKTKEEIDAYNKASKDLDASLAAASQTLKAFFADRTKIVVNWNNVEQKFSDAHMPYYR